MSKRTVYKHELFTTWSMMNVRGHNESYKFYEEYGGRDIKVCKRWRRFKRDSSGFWRFIEDMGDRPEGYTLDRINNDLGYFPENCRWASSTVQNQNRRGRKVSSSQYKGVSWRIRDSKWKAQIMKDGVYTSLGTFESEIEAAKAYDAKATELYGDDAWVNFPKTRRYFLIS